MLELLSPAGSREAVTAAVQNGAGAVYLGYGDYNARRNAKNFTREQLAETVEYCHVRGVKVYLTLNTLLSDAELPGAAKEAAYASEVGVDAVLVQDLGVLDLVRRAAPDVPVHASTQMSVMNLDGVRKCADLGCTRAVLARELSADQIAYICAHSPIEIETFVHGAQCMSYSGQCFFSSVIGGRSGNRGLCAQPCRLSYGWDDRADSPLLSLKDMSLAGHLQELDEMGVACVKIEGRMKRPEYVAIVTGIYAAAIRERREPTKEELEQLRLAFSRQGFSDGYFRDCTGRQMFGVRTDERTPEELFAAARADYGREHPLVGVRGQFVMRWEEPLTLTLTNGTHTVTAQGDCPQQALKRPTTGEEAVQRLSKTGGTPYYVEELTAEADEGLMTPASQLNALRRDALEQLTALRGAKPDRRKGNWAPLADDKARNTGKPALSVALYGAEQYSPELLKHNVALLCLPVEAAQALKDQFAAIHAAGCEIAILQPRVLWDREVPGLERALRALKEAGADTLMVTNLSGVELGDRVGLRLRGDFGLEVYNAECARMYGGLGLESVTLSFEQRLARLRDQKKPVDSEVVAYGRFPLMITQNCIYKARDGKCREGCQGEQSIIDRKKARFPVRKAYGCRNEIFNSLPLWLADRKHELDRCGAWALRLNFTVETAAECARVLAAYASEADVAAPDGFTRGLYFRDVE